MSQKELYDEIYTENKYVGAQYNEENASTVELCKFISDSVDQDQIYTFLDAGCGDGAFINSLMKRFKNCVFSGFDISESMINCAKENLPDVVHVAQGDILNITDFSNEKYDITVSVHTLSLFNDFEEPMKQLMIVSKKFIFINSLFSPHNIDIRTKVSEPGLPDIPWNIWSIKRFSDFTYSLGAKSIKFRPFEMPYELSYVEEGTGSYTKKLADNSLLTFTGSLYLPWYLVKITL